MTAQRIPFSDTAEAAFRAEWRRDIRKSDLLTKNERDLLLAFLNLWFVHRNKDGFIHPGVEKLAKRAGVSLRTAKRFLARMRDVGAAIAIAFAKGGRKATRYRLDLMALRLAFLPHGVVTREGELVELPAPATTLKMGLSSVETYLRQFVKTVPAWHTVKTSAHSAVSAGASDAASDHHPAFPPADDPGFDLARIGSIPDFDPLDLLEMAA